MFGKLYLKNRRYWLPILFGSLIAVVFIQFCQDDSEKFVSRIDLSLKAPDQKPLGKPKERPLYAAVELNIRKKLFVGIICLSGVLPDYAQIQNEAIGKHANKVVYFVNKPVSANETKGLNVIDVANLDNTNWLPFLAVNHTIAQFGEDYDWFFFMPDDTFVRGSKLINMLNRMSITQDLYMGVPSTGTPEYCNYSAGITLSQSVLLKFAPQMNICLQTAAHTTDHTENVGRCASQASRMTCTPEANGQKFSSHLNPSFSFESEIAELSKTANFNFTVTVNKVADKDTFRKLQIYFNQVEMDEISLEIADIEKEILDHACLTTEGCDGLTWPLGVPPPYNATNLYEVIRYEYFNHTHLFLGTDFTVVNELSEAYLKDVNELIDFSVEKLNAREPERYRFYKLVNGYKQFDPTRGAFYVLDLWLTDTKHPSGSIELHKRVNLMRPLGLVELMPVPEYMENSTIHIYVPVTSNDTPKDIETFLRVFNETILVKKSLAQRIILTVVYLSGSKWELQTKDATYGVLAEELTKFAINKNTTKLPGNLRVNRKIVSNEDKLNSGNYRQLVIAELASTRVPASALVFIIPLCAEFQDEFLMRIRHNTIQGQQVYMPVPFSQYMPNIAYPVRPFPDLVEMTRDNGFHNLHNYEFVGYFNVDYTSSRDAFLAKYNVKPDDLSHHINDLYDLFVTNQELNLFRATDRNLKCRWQLVDNCDKQHGNDEHKERCHAQRELGLGSKAQLALHLIKNFDAIQS